MLNFEGEKHLSNDTQIVVVGKLSLKYALECSEIGAKN